jgi:hypothetical protein
MVSLLRYGCSSATVRWSPDINIKIFLFLKKVVKKLTPTQPDQTSVIFQELGPAALWRTGRSPDVTVRVVAYPFQPVLYCPFIKKLALTVFNFVCLPIFAYS